VTGPAYTIFHKDEPPSQVSDDWMAEQQVETKSERHMRSQDIPPWVDMDTLCWAICSTPTSVENYVAQGKLPPPRKLGAKRLWKWKEVEE
jgi:hypothetical protein